MRPLLLMAALLAAAPAWSQTLYRSTMPDGSIVIGDRPAPGARQVMEIKPLPVSVIPKQTPGAAPPPAAKSTGPTRTQSLEAAQAELREALTARESARRAQEAGREPESGERLGVAGGGSRFSEDYTRRQQLLQDAVNNAEARVAAAQARVNEVR